MQDVAVWFLSIMFLIMVVCLTTLFVYATVGVLTGSLFDE